MTRRKKNAEDARKETQADMQAEAKAIEESKKAAIAAAPVYPIGHVVTMKLKDYYELKQKAPNNHWRPDADDMDWACLINANEATITMTKVGK